jgi:hypothetical protein
MNIKANKEDYALEWSFKQQFFHIEPVVDAISTNLALFINGGCTDYVLLGIFKNYHDAQESADYLRTQRPDIFTHADDLERITNETEVAEATRD